MPDDNPAAAIPPVTPPPPVSTTAPPDDEFSASLDAAFKSDQMGGAAPDAAPAAPASKTAADAPPPLKLNVPATAAAPEDADIPDDAPTPRRADEWKKYRTAHNTTRALLKDREAKLASLEPRLKDLETLDALRAERDTLKKRADEVSVVNDPSLHVPFDESINREIELAKGRVDPSKVQAFEAIAHLPPGKLRDASLKDFFADMEPWQQASLMATFNAVDRLNAERSAKVDAARKHASDIVARRAAEKEAAHTAAKAQADHAFSSVLGDLRKTDGWKDILGDAAHGPTWESAARKIYSGDMGSEQDVARHAFYASIAPVLLRNLIESSQRESALNEALARMKTATPGVSTPSGARQAPRADDFLDDVFRATR